MEKTVVRGLQDNCGITAINIGTIPNARLQCWTKALLHPIIVNIIAKCPKLTHLVLHGVDLEEETIMHMGENLPTSLISLDISGNYFFDQDIKRLVERCPNLEFLDTSSTLLSHRSLPYITEGWRHSMKNLALPRDIAIKLQAHTLKPNLTRDEDIGKFAERIEAMPKLTHLRIGNWKHDTSTAAQRTPQGDMTREYIFERETAKTLKDLFPHLVIHLDPHRQDDGGNFFQANGHPEPNPDYPHESDPSHIFRLWGRAGKRTDRDPSNR